MNKGKIIVIEGTDCSGKETQSKLLVQNLKKLQKSHVQRKGICFLIKFTNIFTSRCALQ